MLVPVKREIIAGRKSKNDETFPTGKAQDSMQQLKIRKATPDDDIPWDLLMDADSSVKAVQKYLRKGELWLAEYRGKVVGEMILLPTRSRVMEIMNIAVAERMRSRGIGTRLLKAAKRIAQRAGARTLEVGTGNNSFRQLAFYQRCGFRMIGIRRNFFAKRYRKTFRRDGVPLLDMIVMELPVVRTRKPHP